VATGVNDASGRHPTRKYGDNGAVSLVPASGDALTAQANGRTGIMIHGGALDSAGLLRRTNGCVRLSNDDMATLVGAINALGGDALTTITIRSPMLFDAGAPDEPDDDGNPYDEGDPPPGAGPIGKGQNG